MLRTVSVSALLLLAVTACASPPVVEGPSLIDDRAVTIMERLCKQAAAMRDARFTLVDTMDEVQPNGQKLQFRHRRHVTLSRPTYLHVETVGDRAHRSLWKDGSTVTLADHDHEVFATLDDPGTIDEMMDMLFFDYGISTPLADILSAEPHEIFLAGVRRADYVGEHDAGGVPCHHLAFQLHNLDYQVWVSKDEERLKKMVITYWQLPGEPQYTLWIEDASTPEEGLTQADFAAEVPVEYERLELQPLLAETAP